MESTADVEEIFIETEEVHGEIIHVVVETPGDRRLFCVNEVLQRLFPDVQRPQLQNRLSRTDVKLRLATPAAVAKLRELGVVAPGTSKTSLVASDDVDAMMEILREISRPRKSRSEENEWKSEAVVECMEGEELGSRTRAPVEGKGIFGENEVNEIEFDEEEDEMAVLPEDDDDEDFYVPSMAQKEKKMKRSRAAGGGKTSQTSKCGRGRKQCPNCQIVVPTCRTQCTECSYQFVVHSSSPGDGASADIAAEPGGVTAAPIDITSTAGQTETQTKTKSGTKKQVTKKRKKEGIAGKTLKKGECNQQQPYGGCE